jgi:hypothetical protein
VPPAGLWYRPLQVCGSLGIVALSLLLTYEFPWESWHHAIADWRAAWPALVLTAGLPLVAVLLVLSSLRRLRFSHLMAGLMPVAAVAGYAAASAANAAAPAQILFNAFLLAWGVGVLWEGVRAGSLRGINAGMFSVSLLIVARFFDSDLGFVARGVAFIVLGVVFLVTNVLMLRKGGAR